MKAPAQYFMIGGFLGAGKTTAVAALAEYLNKQGLRVGLITNDQGSELVDTSMLRSKGFATEEIAGGCFCCRFNSLMDAATKLTEASRPEAFVAEPVGSCTDLIATVTYPLRRMYGNQFQVAPLSVLVDPIRAQQILGLREGRSFSEKVLYIWRKQIEEADLVVITKSDLISSGELEDLRERLQKEFSGKKTIAVSVRQGKGIEEWFEWLRKSPAGAGQAMKVDYDIYAEGEALLGWLNATVDVEGLEGIDSSKLMRSLAAAIQRDLKGSEIAHLKMTLSPSTSLAGEMAALSVVRNDVVPELTLSLEEPVTKGQLIINCRAEAAPEELKRAVTEGIESMQGLFPRNRFKVDHMEHFRPGRPQPTHRLERLEREVNAV